MKLSRTELIGVFAVGVYLLFFAVNPPAPIRMLLSNTVLLALTVGGAVYVTMYLSKAVGILLILAVLLSMTSVTEHLTAGCTTPPPQKGFDRPGPDIETIANVQSPQECADKCCGNAQCNSYTYNGDNRRCILKSGSGTPEPAIANAYTGVVTRSAGSSTASPQTTPAAALPMTTTSATPGSTVPPTLANGKIYKCTGTSEYGVVLNNKLSAFPNPEVAVTYSESWSADATEIECTSFDRSSQSAPRKTAAPPATPASSTAAPALAKTPEAPVMACNLENFENFAPF
jgi:hypothetical protein